MDRLIKLLEANGMKLSPPPEREPSATKFEVDGELITVILKEHVRRRERGLTQLHEFLTLDPTLPTERQIQICFAETGEDGVTQDLRREPIAV